MQHLPCGCRRSGRRNCIVPNCPNESTDSRNDLYFCPVARKRNLTRTGEPEICPIELPANTWTQIKHTGRCARHKKEMEEDLARKKRRQEKEEEKRKQLEREREKKEKEEWEERMRGGGGSGSGGNRMAGLGLIREGVEETGNGSGMDVDEFRHVNKVLEARDRARAAGGGVKVEMGTGVERMGESGLGMGPVSEGLRRMALDMERKRDEEDMAWKERMLEEDMVKVKKERKEREERREEKEKKKKEEKEKRRKEEEKKRKEEEQKLTRMAKEVQVQTATDMLKDMVAKDWEEEVRLGGPAMADVAKFAGARKVSEIRLRLEMEAKKNQVSSSSMAGPT
ncbi:hypothetical protein SMACR_08111 [Sordaria macrospora]|uniref:Uncharacterized protein n=1 Tax=Sordaria macrospora TaxID=5147 RepID=A0A8S8ZEE3_SORMA|nr:hypothetical protein SMACR_08111 [Sordaria macrospora]WPJ65033.1 hypothetical protein SMAC4_08111 [Sordaria macrospora]